MIFHICSNSVSVRACIPQSVWTRFSSARTEEVQGDANTMLLFTTGMALVRWWAVPSFHHSPCLELLPGGLVLLMINQLLIDHVLKHKLGLSSHSTILILLRCLSFQQRIHLCSGLLWPLGYWSLYRPGNSKKCFQTFYTNTQSLRLLYQSKL